MKIRLKPLAEQVIVITGASSGIGLATALRAGRKGAKLVLAARDDDALNDVAKQIRNAGGQASAVVTDVADEAQVEALAQAALAAHGRIDTWVNDAGVGIWGRLEDIDPEDHKKLFDVNFWGIVHGTLTAAKHMKTAGGAIINLGSVVADIGFPMQGMYSASKHAVKGFTDAFRMEMQAVGAPISVTLIKPAAIDTPFAQHARNATDGKPTLPPPVYTPDDVAMAILHAAVRGGRDYYVGGAGKLMSAMNNHLPSLVDWFGANFVTRQSVSDRPSGRDDAGTLDHPGASGETRGDSGPAMRSLYTEAVTRPWLTAAVLAATAGVAAGLMRRKD